jgi:neutral amino acid transport system permease protein
MRWVHALDGCDGRGDGLQTLNRPIRRARRPAPGLLAGIAAVLVGAVVISTFIAPVAPAAAQSTSSEVVAGRLVEGGEPVAGVRIVVTTADDVQVGEVFSGEDGSWQLELPAAGRYVVVLDVASLPEDVGLRDPDRDRIELNVFENARSVAVFALGEAQDRGSQFLGLLAQNAVNGLKFGLIIAMSAIGLSLIFGTTGLVNFAHGDLVTVGAFTAFFLNVSLGVPLLLAAPLAIVLTALFTGSIDRWLWRPLRKRQTGLIAMLVVSIGLGFVLRHLALLLFGGSRSTYAQYSLQQARTFGPIRLQPTEVVVMALSVAILIGVGLLLNRTRLGKAMRAVADERDLAESSGIDVERVVLAVWIVGGALTATGGIFLGMIESVDYLMGFRLLLLMFAAVILGGLGSAYGAMVGGIVVGLVSEVSTVWFSSQLKYVWALLVMVIILLVRPQGILGRKERIG